MSGTDLVCGATRKKFDPDGSDEEEEEEEEEVAFPLDREINRISRRGGGGGGRGEVGSSATEGRTERRETGHVILSAYAPDTELADSTTMCVCTCLRDVRNSASECYDHVQY
eukprot:178024-Rhodomonas_salina.1